MKTSPHLQERSLAGAVRDTVLSPLTGPVAKYAMIVVLCSLPLYAMGYQNGQFGVAGWFSGFFLGGVAATAILFLESERLSDDALGCICDGAIRRTLIVGIGLSVPIALYAKFVSGFDVVSGSAWATSVATNTLVWAWKPLAHVGAVATTVIVVGQGGIADVIGLEQHGDANRDFVTAPSLMYVVVSGIGMFILALIPVAGLLSTSLATRFVFRLAFEPERVKV